MAFDVGCLVYVKIASHDYTQSRIGHRRVGQGHVHFVHVET